LVQMASLAVKARMRTSAAGSNPNRGFTLLELLVVVAIMAIATAGVGLALRDSSRTMLEREAQRLMALLESARAQSRMSANPIRWRTTDKGFFFDGATPASLPTAWLGADVQAVANGPVVLGPEPIIAPQRIRLATLSSPVYSLILATDGVRPFAVVADAEAVPVAP
jgi:general secretion pathway protein H